MCPAPPPVRNAGDVSIIPYRARLSLRGKSLKYLRVVKWVFVVFLELNAGLKQAIEGYLRSQAGIQMRTCQQQERAKASHPIFTRTSAPPPCSHAAPPAGWNGWRAPADPKHFGSKFTNSFYFRSMESGAGGEESGERVQRPTFGELYMWLYDCTGVGMK